MRKVRQGMLLVVLLVACYQPSTAQEKPAVATQELCFLAYWGTSRIGWDRMTLTHETVDGQERHRLVDSQFFRIKRSFDNSVFDMTEKSETLYDAKWKPLSISTSKFDGAQKSTREVVYSEKSISVTEASGGGKPVKFDISIEGKNVLDDKQAFEALKAGGKLKSGERFTFDRFDAENKTIEPSTWIINGESVRKSRAGEKLTGLSISVIQGGSRTEGLFDSEGMPVWILSGAMILVERVSKIPEPFEVDELSAIKTVMDANIVVPGEMENIDQMEIHFEFPKDDGDGIPELLDSNAYHDVVRYEKGKKTGYAARLKSQRLGADFKSPAFPLESVEDSAKAFLNATANCESNDPVLVKKAQELVKKCKDSRAAAQAVCKFVFLYLKKMSGKSGSATARQAYDEKKGDCTEHSALFVALARAAGLPARCCGGVVYAAGGGQAIWGYHAWSEVWLGKWVPVDATVNEVGTSGRYMFFQLDEPGESGGNGRTARCLANGLDPVIDAYKLIGKEEVREENAAKFDFGK